MRYYCKNCGSEIRTEYECKYGCPNPNCPSTGTMQPVPGYETPDRFKERTGEVYPKNGAVYAFNSYINKWQLLIYDALEIFNPTAAVVIADPPVPPPDNWRPE